MPIVATTSGKRFVCADGESLLDAGLRAGVALAYSCRTGRCSTCKGRVLGGSTTAMRDETGLTVVERAGGWILTCVRGAASDLLLDATDLGALDLIEPRTLPCRIHTIERPAADVVRVLLRLPPTTSFRAHPGQYVDIIGQGGIRRSYSLANAVAVGGLLEVHVRQVPGGTMSDYWFSQAAAGDLLRLHGPLGTFFLRDVDGLDLVLLATGTGIAPVKAMLEGIAGGDSSQPRSVSVYWGGRVAADHYCDVADIVAGVRVVPVLSRGHDGWSGARGHVQHVALAERGDWSEAAVYACGSDAMVHGARELLVAAGLPPSRFQADSFLPSGAA